MSCRAAPIVQYGRCQTGSVFAYIHIVYVETNFRRQLELNSGDARHLEFNDIARHHGPSVHVGCS